MVPETTDLSSILTPALFGALVDARIPFPTTGRLDFTAVSRKTAREVWLRADVSAQAWPALVFLSKIGLSEMPDLMQFLPAPQDASFPRLALGLQILLDQAPRSLCKRLDKRWIFAYFDVLSLRLAHRLDALPATEKPFTWDRWRFLSSLDYWVLARMWFGVPFVQSEDRLVHRRALSFFDETRLYVEVATGTLDPFRVQRDDILTNLYLRSTIPRTGPTHDGVTLQDYTYWMCLLMDTSKPILDFFGRYPTRNAYLGRQNTPEEEMWLTKSTGVIVSQPDVAERIRRDMDAGIWTPLGRD